MIVKLQRPIDGSGPLLAYDEDREIFYQFKKTAETMALFGKEGIAKFNGKRAADQDPGW